MLTENEFVTWFSRNGVSEEAQSVIARIRSSDPARRVGGGKRNVAGRYPSRKMRVTRAAGVGELGACPPG
jgi:hypothetical protein